MAQQRAPVDGCLFIWWRSPKGHGTPQLWFPPPDMHCHARYADAQARKGGDHAKILAEHPLTAEQSTWTLNELAEKFPCPKILE